MPVTPLPDGSGVTTGTLGPQDTTSWAFASSYQRTFSPTLLNELRIGDTRRTVGRAPRSCPAPPSSSLGLPGIPSTAQFPNTLPTFLDRRLSAARIAAEHGDGLQHERHADRRHADLGQGPAHDQDRRRLALGAAERHPAAVADRRRSRSAASCTRPAGRREHRHAVRQLPARTGAAVLDRSAAGRDPGTARTSRSTSSRTTGGSPIG